ncbi:MAG: DNA primase [Candidatus Micrarchaeota archaeon]|nr:DNA primase [Candidatus Micrarchaeota archaeon]
MAKTYLDIVKYMVLAKFSIDGLVDKPDIIGAVFGQTEGLLGDELDLRELQKSGKIGRIEIDVSQSGSKTYGKLFLPASLDRVETCILAAAVESVDRVGPFEAQFQVDKVEDTRAEKRRKILDRAKTLMKLLLATEIPDSKELSELVQSEVKSSEIVEYGPDHLPAGPDISKNDEVIFVEGRADVINLLRNNITNAIAIGGATSTIPKTIVNLATEKEVTVFVDGDRGGEMIIRGLLNVLDIDFVARAPDGKEVEELARKEVIKSLRGKEPIEQYLGIEKAKLNAQRADRRDGRNGREQHYSMPPQQHRTFPPPQPQQRAPEQPAAPRPVPESPGEEMFEQVDKPYIKDLRNDEEENATLQKIEPAPMSRDAGLQVKPVLESALLAQLANGLVELSGSLRSRVYAPDGNIIKEVPIRELLTTLQDMHGAYAIVLDGVITQRLVELSLDRGIKAIYGIRANPMPRHHPELILYTKEQGKLE